MSVDAKDLRIGNHVLCKGIHDVVYGIMDNDYYTEKHYHGVCNDDLEPILLNEDVLLKCGFDNTKQSNKNYFKHPKISGGIFLGSNYSIYKYTNIIIELNWLHKLQNLYFALTGQELTVNL